VIRLAAWLGEALGSSASLFGDFSSEVLGLALPDAVLQAPAVKSALKQAEDGAKAVGAAAADLDTVAGGGDEIQILGALVRFGAELAKLFAALDTLSNAVQAAITPGTIPDAAQRAAAGSFAQALAKAVGDYAIASAITERTPHVAAVLKLAGLLDWQYEGPTAGNPLSRGHVRKKLRLDRLKDLIKDPPGYLTATLGWGNPAFDPSGFFQLVREFFGPEDSIEVGMQGGDPFIRGCVLVRRDRSVNPPGLLATFAGDLGADLARRSAITDDWDVGVTSSLRLAGGMSASVRPPLDVRIQPLSGQVTGELRGFFERNAAKRPFDILGGTGLLSISANNLTSGVGLKANWDGSAAHIDPLFFTSIDGVTLKVGSDDADSFIGTLLSSADIEGQFDLGLEWQATTGLRITASGGIEISLPIHKEIGPVELETIYLGLKIKNDGTISLETSAGLTGKLGPLSVTVERVGAQLDLRFVDGAGADFGPFDLDLAFKPPSGAGLSIDAGIVSGGGYLYFDPDKGEYAGVAELAIAGIVTVKAIALITTKMPDGSDGFSLLLIITTDFPPLQLGFGFTLNAVGGLLGLNRAVLLDVLRDGVRTGAINSIMFPQDVIANAPRIISDLKAVFPPQNGTFLIGPMAKFGWGTPSLITLSLGIILEIPPGNIAILGVLKIALPAEDVALIQIQVNFLGTLDFDKQLLTFDASLFESRILFLTLEGDMAVRLKWGDDAGFLLSVGGFHPSFKPPPALNLPSMKRLAINILDLDWAKIRVESYFAVTSNTVQFGAHAYLFFGLDEANVSGHIGFDVLFQFSPFYFNALISASLSIEVFGLDLMSISLRGSLEGPAPWHAHGTGSLSILFFDIDVDIDVSWGDAKDTSLPPVEVMPIFLAEANKDENWKALPPPQTSLLVSLRKLEGSEIVLHPLGALAVTQRALPLAFTLDKVGAQKPVDVSRVDITAAANQGAPLPLSGVDEQFALAQFQKLSDAEKLSRPSFQPVKGGVVIGTTTALASSKMTRRRIAYEIVIEDKEPRRPLKGLLYKAVAGLFHPFLAGAAVARSPLSNRTRAQLQPFDDKIAVGPESFTVASSNDNKPLAADAVFTSEAKAHDYMRGRLAADPSLAGTMHVLPNHEVNAA
jgi:hypothetical protein